MGAWEDAVTKSILCFEAKLALNQELSYQRWRKQLICSATKKQIKVQG